MWFDFSSRSTSGSVQGRSKMAFFNIFRSYPYSHNHGSQKWVPPIVRTFQIQPFSTSMDYGRKSMSQLETQHHQVTMLGNNKYTKPVGKFGSFVCLSLWSVEEMRFHGTIQSYEIHCEFVWLHPNSLERKKHSKLFPPTTQGYQLFKRPLLLIIATIGWQGSWWLQWSWCLQGWCFCLGSIANTCKNRFHRDRSFYYEVLIYKINDTTTRHRK